MAIEPQRQGSVRMYDYTEGVFFLWSHYLFILQHSKNICNKYCLTIHCCFSVPHTQVMVILLTSSHWGYDGFHLKCPVRITLNSTGGRPPQRRMRRATVDHSETLGASLCLWHWKELWGKKHASEGFGGVFLVHTQLNILSEFVL